MGQNAKPLNILVIDPDEALAAELRSGVTAFVGLVLHAPGAAADDMLAACDVCVIGVDCPAGLALLADVCGRADAPPVIALGGVTFEGKPPEHVLLLAELRGAAAALPKPVRADELARTAAGLVGRSYATCAFEPAERRSGRIVARADGRIPRPI